MIETMAETCFQPITDFGGARDALRPQERLREIRKRAAGFRERFLEEPPVRYYRSVDLLRVPYPASYAFHGVYAPRLFRPLFVHLLNRLAIVRFEDFEGKLRTLLSEPSDFEAGRETPFFKRLAQRLPGLLFPLIAPVTATVPDALAAAGIDPREVDYITYDHLHTQDLRRWLGTGTTPGLFANARLLVHRREWESVRGLLPTQAEWYCPHGSEGIDPRKVVQFDTDIQLGRGLALMHTPGHTEGNHSLVVRAPEGIRVSSENGVAADCYAPDHSRHNAIRRFAQATGAEVILNGNTLESSNDQYLSMVQEKTIAGPSPNPDFPNCVPSSECTPYWLFPRTPVSFLFGPSQFGKLTV
jgi:hypothetical protein